MTHRHIAHNSTEVHSDKALIDEAVHDLLENRCIRRVEQRPIVCSSLSMVSNLADKLFRLVLF